MTPQRDHAGASLQPLDELHPKWSEDGLELSVTFGDGRRVAVRLDTDKTAAQAFVTFPGNDPADPRAVVGEREARALSLMFSILWLRIYDRQEAR